MVDDVSGLEVGERRSLRWLEVGILVGIIGLPIWFSEAIGYRYPALPLVLDGFLRLTHDIPICLLVIYFMVRSGRDWNYFGLGKNWDFVGLITFAGGIVAAGMFSSWMIDILIQAIDPGRVPPDSSVFGAVPRSVPEWLTMWPILLVGATAEELVFRGYLTPAIYEATGKKWLAVLIPAIIFGSLHTYQGFIEAVGITVFGALFGIMFLEWRRLKALILAHFAFNLWAFSYWI